MSLGTFAIAFVHRVVKIEANKFAISREIMEYNLV